jgi:hypothetical protein
MTDDRIQWTGENIASVSWFLKADVFRRWGGGLTVKPSKGPALHASRGDWFIRQWDGSIIVECAWL